MGSRRVADTPSPARRRQAAAGLPLSPAAPLHSRDILLRSWPGRLFLGAVAIKLLVILLRQIATPPAVIEILSTAASIAIVVAFLYFLGRLFLLVKRRLLWRVRRKLILSYVFIGVVPALLIVGFFLLATSVVSTNLSAYLFKDGVEDMFRNAAMLSEWTSADIARAPDLARDTVARAQRSAAQHLQHPALSVGFIPESAAGLTPLYAGDWEHVTPPRSVPAWIKARAEGFAGLTKVAAAGPGAAVELVARAVKPVAVSGRGRIGYVIIDVPFDGVLVDRLHERTGIRSGSVDVGGDDAPSDSPRTAGEGDPLTADQFALFGRSVAFFDSVEWESGDVHRLTVALAYGPGELYSRVSRAQSVQLRLGANTVADAILLFLIFVGVLFLIIEMAALTMGLALARSMTSSIHELFMGTERVRLGDFTHRIDIRTKDQLGELADSFNQMTGSIENLLQTAAEKKRLEEELRIARQIQMSLLPTGPLEMPGLAVTALCVPAREVGGDYYDYFRLGREKVGLLVADVSGKGTSAALYMAELKGLMLSLSQIHHSPRQLLLEANRILSENLDSRSFITMVYAVIDLARGTMTYARAGHTPIIYLPGASTTMPTAQVLLPDGMVLGLRIDGAAEKFEELLEEHVLQLRPDDIVVLYTDGITEAMNAENDLFGEGRLSRIVEEHGHLDSAELRERILREIEAFVGGADQHDDMTMILLKVEHAMPARVAV